MAKLTRRQKQKLMAMIQKLERQYNELDDRTECEMKKLDQQFEQRRRKLERQFEQRVVKIERRIKKLDRLLVKDGEKPVWLRNAQT